jgi:hypothetical protein
MIAGLPEDTVLNVLNKYGSANFIILKSMVQRASFGPG